MKKYIIVPDTVRSKSDGDIHYIGAGQLIRLYGVNPTECVVADHWNKVSWLKRIYGQNMIVLRPRYHGDYDL